VKELRGTRIDFIRQKIEAKKGWKFISARAYHGEQKFWAIVWMEAQNPGIVYVNYKTGEMSNRPPPRIRRSAGRDDEPDAKAIKSEPAA